MTAFHAARERPTATRIIRTVAEEPAGQAIAAPPATDEPPLSRRAGVPVDGRTIGFPSATVEIVDWSDFQ